MHRVPKMTARLIYCSLVSLIALLTAVPAEGAPLFGIRYDPLQGTFFDEYDPVAGTLQDSTTLSGFTRTSGLTYYSGLFYSSGGTSEGLRLFSIDPATGTGTSIGTTSFLSGQGTPSLEFNPVDGTLYATARVTDTVYSVDPLTGNVTPLFQITPTDILGLAIDGSGMAYISTGGGELYNLDLGTGSTSLIGSMGLSGTALWDLAFDENGTLYGAIGISSDISAYTIDTGTAGITEAFALQSNTNGIAFEATSATGVPEPSSFALLGLVLLAMGISLARNKRAACSE